MTADSGETSTGREAANDGPVPRVERRTGRGAYPSDPQAASGDLGGLTDDALEADLRRIAELVEPAPRPLLGLAGVDRSHHPEPPGNHAGPVCTVCRARLADDAGVLPDGMRPCPGPQRGVEVVRPAGGVL